MNKQEQPPLETFEESQRKLQKKQDQIMKEIEEQEKRAAEELKTTEMPKRPMAEVLREKEEEKVEERVEKPEEKEEPKTPPSEPEAEKEEIKEKKELEFDSSVLEKSAKFNLNKEDLENIESFADLSTGQQLLVLANLEQLNLGRVQDEALAKYRENTSQAKFRGRIWQNISKKYQIARLEKATAEEITKGGLEVHEQTLQQLVNGMKVMGLEVIKNEKGELEIQYAGGLENLSPEEQEKVRQFNQIANEFSKTPAERAYKSATSKERKGYQELKEKYEKARGEFLNLRLKVNDNNQREAALYLNNIDGKVQLNQFLNTHPGVEKQLQKIKDKKVWQRAMFNIATERGLYAAAGFITRSVTMSMVGLAGIPLAAAGMGGILTGRRAKETLIEAEKMARRGRKEGLKEKESKKNIVEAPDLTKKLDWLIGKIDSEENSARRKELVGRLKVLVEANEGRIEKGWVNFGQSQERLKNQLDLIQDLSKARVYVEGEEKSKLVKTDLEKILNLRQEKISKTQRNYILKQVGKGALWGAGLALSGMALRHLAEGWFGWGKPGSAKVLDKTTTRPESRGTITPEDLQRGRTPGTYYEEQAEMAKRKLEEAIEKETATEQLTKAPEVGKTPGVIATVEEAMKASKGFYQPEEEIYPIGERGPEGVIIDLFKNDPELAKHFGWQEGMNIDRWTGTKAHQLWLEHAKEALKNKDLTAKMEKLGYSKDINGYLEMMRRVGKGYVEIDPQSGKMNLVEMEYLKAKAPSGAEILTKPAGKPITVPLEYQTGKKGRLYEEVIKDYQQKYPAQPLGTSTEVSQEMIKCFEDYNFLEQERTVKILDTDIKNLTHQVAQYSKTDSQIATQLNKELTRWENLRDVLKDNLHYGANQEGFEKYKLFLADDLTRHAGLKGPDFETFYNKVNKIKIGKFIEELTKYEKKETDWPDLPSYSGYKKAHWRLLEIFRSPAWQDADKDLTIESVIKSKIKM